MRKKGLIVTIIMLIVTLFMGICVNVVKAQETPQQSLFEATYDLGETLNVPTRNILVNGVSTPSEAVVIYPDGSAVATQSVTLSKSGVYTVEYRAQANGKTYKESYHFTVAYPKYTLAAKNDFATYKEVTVNGQTKEGLHVKLEAGSRFTCNQVIDLTQIKEGEPFISLYITPDTYMQLDCSQFYIDVVDAEDESNYFTILVKNSPYHNDKSYVGAKAHNQDDYWGAYTGDKNGSLMNGPHGFIANAGFRGVNFGLETAAMRFSYDNATQTLYMDNCHYGGNYLIDFNNFACFKNGWDGFTSEKVRISAYASGYAKDSMSFLVTSIAQVDLTQAEMTLTEPTGLDIDFGEYSNDDYPRAVVGKPYRIFDATPWSMYTQERVDVTVKTSYGSSNELNVNIEDGCFVPQRAVTHTIVYTVTDGFGNVKEYPVPVKVDTDYPPITFEIEEEPEEINAELGAWVDIPQVQNATGGNGILREEIVLKNTTTGKTVVIEGESYRFVEQGEYVLIYTVKDYNECATTKELPVVLQAAQKPVFEEKLVLPFTYIKGATYAVPMLQADDFSTGSLKKVNASVKVFGDATELTVTDGYFVADGAQITFQYTAKDGQQRVSTVEYTKTVTDVGFTEENLDASNYFQAVGGEAILGEKIVENIAEKVVYLKATKENAEFAFIRELNGENFSVAFYMDADKTEYEKVRFHLQDMYHADKYVDVVLINQDGKVFVSVNGGTAVKTNYKFGGDISRGVLRLRGTMLFICNEYILVDTYANGEAFEGFENCVYLTIGLEGCDDDAQLHVDEINGQSLTFEARDLGPTFIFPEARCVGEKEYGSTLVIEPVKAIDVFDPYAVVTFSVFLPSNEFATALDGTLLKNVPMDKTYQLQINAYGRYRFEYKGKATRGRDGSSSENVTCLDKVAPEINVSTNELTGKVGEALTIPEYSVSDNLSGSEILEERTYIQIITPDQIFISYNVKTGYIPEKAGVYTIRYFVFDEEFNVTMVDVVCRVE